MDRAVEGVAARASRSDAVRNRASIMKAASHAFATQGSGADVREIARSAGVGMGTLYRHFPTKDVLLDTVLHEHFAEWTRTAREAAAAEDPAEALRAFLHDALERQARHRALVEQFAQTWDTADAVNTCSRELNPAIDALVERCHQAGALRPGVTGQDIALMLAGLGRIAQMSGTQGRDTSWHRALQIVLDGLQPVHGRELPSA